MKNALMLALGLSLIGCGDVPVFVVEGEETKTEGPAGLAGKDGQGCDVQQVLPSEDVPAGGALLTCGANSVLILNGTDGEDAQLPPYSIVEIINPCGDAAGVVDEILLKLQNGQILASVLQNANGQNTRLSLMPPGSWKTTDGDNCFFTITNSGTITNEYH